jgi:hypothetical protein
MSFVIPGKMSPGNIKVLNKKTHVACEHDVYIGRPTILGNPFSHLDSVKGTVKTATREEAVAKYMEWLRGEYFHGSPVQEELDKIAVKYRNGEIIHLICWCAPLACHGDMLKQAIIGITKKWSEL